MIAGKSNFVKKVAVLATVLILVLAPQFVNAAETSDLIKFLERASNNVEKRLPELSGSINKLKEEIKESYFGNDIRRTIVGYLEGARSALKELQKEIPGMLAKLRAIEKGAEKTGRFTNDQKNQIKLIENEVRKRSASAMESLQKLVKYAQETKPTGFSSVWSGYMEPEQKKVILDGITDISKRIKELDGLIKADLTPPKVEPQPPEPPSDQPASGEPSAKKPTREELQRKLDFLRRRLQSLRKELQSLRELSKFLNEGNGEEEGGSEGEKSSVGPGSRKADLQRRLDNLEEDPGPQEKQRPGLEEEQRKKNLQERLNKSGDE